MELVIKLKFLVQKFNLILHKIKSRLDVNMSRWPERQRLSTTCPLPFVQAKNPFANGFDISFLEKYLRQRITTSKTRGDSALCEKKNETS